MKKIVIYGAGGFGREVQWLIESINEVSATWEILGYLDDGVEVGTLIDGYPVLGGLEKLQEYDSSLAIVCAVGSAKVRKQIIERIKRIGDFQFPSLIAPDVRMSNSVMMGIGNVICAGNIMTVDIELGDFNILNLSCTVGHDVKMESFVTVYPGVNISGCVRLAECVELGTGSKIIQGKNICKNVIVGAGAVIVKALEVEGTYVGVPARRL